MTNRNSAPISHQQITKKSIQVTDHYSVHIGLAPSFKLTGSLRKYHYHRYASSPCVTATHFVRSSRSIPLLQCNVSTFPHVHSYQRAGTSWRIYLVAPHILTSCMQKIFSCQGTGCIRSNQRMERDNANRLLCNFKSQYLCNQLCF